MIQKAKNYYNEKVNKVGMQPSNKTGLVFKISAVLFVLLALVVYKLNDYFKNEKQFLSETQLRSKVVQAKTTVSSQVSQLKNVLSSYETELADTSINWVQLDPFFAIAKVEDTGRSLKVSKLLVRSNTPAESWNENYLERALALNKSNSKSPLVAQLFQDRAGSKFLILRFKNAQKRELALVGSAEYFQKFFDNERGERSTALLVTAENMLAAHSEGDYIATLTQEAKLSKKKYLIEREEIPGTNLIAMNYILKKKISSGFVVPWSIVGVVVGFGFILVAVVFYSLDPIERKVERYKKQEREQIYKDTVGSMVGAAANSMKPAKAVVFPEMRENAVLQQKEQLEKTRATAEATQTKSIFQPEEQVTKTVRIEQEKVIPKSEAQPEVIVEVKIPDPTEEELERTRTNILIDHFKALEEPQIDISDIEKALALDELTPEDEGAVTIAAEMLKENLTSQKISITPGGAKIDKPSFALNKKEFKVNDFKVHVRRPDNS